MAQEENAPDWVKHPVENIRHGLVQQGYDNEKLGLMKMEDVLKLNFMNYVTEYVRWHRSEKLKKD